MSENVNHEEELHAKVKGQRFVMLTSPTAGGMESRPMTVQEMDGWTLRFIAQADNDVITQSEGQRVNLSIMDGGTFVSLTGSATVSRSVEEKRELWDRLNEAYAGDPEDPANVILDVRVDEGAYWDSGNILTRIVGLAKAAATGERPDLGEHGQVTL